MMPISPRRMPIMAHIVELRHRMLVIVMTMLVGSLVLYSFTTPILDLLLRPVADLLPDGQLNVFGPFEPFSFRFRIAIFSAVVVGSPIWVYQILAFFLPALKPKEQRWFFPTFFAMLVLFLAGVGFCYYVILHPAFAWMIGQGGDIVSIIPDATKFLSAITLLLLAFGAAFQLPLIVFYLIALGVAPYSAFRENWRYAYVALVIFAAGATPDWSPVTMGALAGALIGLYELSLLIARLVFQKRIKAQALAEADEDSEDEQLVGVES